MGVIRDMKSIFNNESDGGILFYWYKSFFLPNQDIFFIEKFNNKTVINERGIYLYLYSSLSCVVVCLFGLLTYFCLSSLFKRYRYIRIKFEMLVLDLYLNFGITLHTPTRPLWPG